ncbi:excalibur calcium-binding domain-containing protein [Nocardia sp. NPDC127579]|uniref:excalibur calcium-binding domain-containing protein n=1 Tax=Nocardia sp. NPDC127579 TaxID=3345402 RepID=UPI0036336303
MNTITDLATSRRTRTSSRARAASLLAAVCAAAALITAFPAAVQASPDVYYPDCDAARAAGAAPLYRGDPGYRPPLDRDDDGVACEPYPR